MMSVGTWIGIILCGLVITVVIAEWLSGPPDG
jgi:hypothetical protein